MTSKTAPDLGALFQSARQDDIISDETHSILKVADLGASIQDAMGTPADSFQQSEVVLVAADVDDSFSIRAAGNAQAIRDGHNLVIDALRKSKQQDNVLFHTRFLNGKIICPYGSIDQAVRLDSSNYDPQLGTPLYDSVVSLLGTVLAKSQEFADQGVPCRTITLILTDGADLHSTRFRPGDVAKLVNDMLRQENHIIAFMGVEDPHDKLGVDFRIIATGMGIRDEWILTPGSSESEIRKACQVFSQSAVRASQSAASFSQQAMGGFGSP